MNSPRQLARAARRLERAQAELSAAIGDLIGLVQEAGPVDPDDRYLSLDQLVSKLPLGKSTIRSYMHSGELREGVHFFRHGNRPVFKWSAMVGWIEGRGSARDGPPVIPFRKAGGAS